MSLGANSVPFSNVLYYWRQHALLGGSGAKGIVTLDDVSFPHIRFYGYKNVPPIPGKQNTG